jgi:hypothetical protein
VNYSIRAVTTPADDISLLGPVDDILSAPNKQREITFLLRVKQAGKRPRPVLLQLICGDTPVASVKASP